MKMTRILKKMIALVFAGMTFVSVRGNALASEKETVTVLPTTTIEEMVDEVSQEEKADLMLTEEEKAFYEQFVDAKGNHFLVDDYENYLTENCIKTIDGNIIIETIEDFEAIVQYFKQYLKSNDVMWADVQVRDYLMTLNIAFIPKEIIQDLASQKKITVPFDYNKLLTKTSSKIVEELIKLAEKNSKEEFLTKFFVIFNREMRSCVISAEKHLQKYVACQDKEEGYNDYIDGLYDFYLFLTEKESAFPSNIATLDSSAKFTFKIISVETAWTNAAAGGPILKEFSNYAADKKARTDALEAIQEYTDLIQEAPVKTK